MQLCEHLASASIHPYVRHLGADQMIDYNTEDFAIGQVCDVVFDTVGGGVRAGCNAVLKRSGKLLWIAPAPRGFQSPKAAASAWLRRSGLLAMIAALMAIFSA